MVRGDIHDIAERKLATINQRYSSRRRRLVEALDRADHPLIATDIVAVDDDLPQSSVYRNLAVLEAAGVVVKVLTNGDRAAFELAEELKGHHHHLVCVQCGLVLDIDVPNEVEQSLDTGVAELVSQAGFILVGHRLDLLGRCGNCA
jgi:Fur family ferric uptake transcriptional regulator